jgi:hypothetical protein
MRSEYTQAMPQLIYSVVVVGFTRPDFGGISRIAAYLATQCKVFHRNYLRQN